MARYKVIMNRNKEYSIWPEDRENALGWNDVGRTGTKDQCIKYIEEVWTDLSSVELRRKITHLRNL